MRFNFKNVGEGIGALGDAYNKVQLGRMYDEASKQTMRPAGEGSPEEQARAAEEANKLQLQDFEMFANQADKERGNLGANYQMPASTSSAVDRYGLGTKPTELRNTPYTPSERRTVGLEAQADFLARQGRTEEASRLLDTVEARKTGALNQQLLQENVSNAGLRRQGLVQGIEKGGLDIAAGKQGLDLGKLNLTAQQRTETNNKNVDAVSLLMAQAEALPVGNAQRVRIEGEIKAKTAGLPVDVQSSMVALAKNRMELKRVQSEEAYIKAVDTPEAFVAHYNSELRDGSTAKIIKNKDGTTSIVTYKEGDDTNTQERFRFKEWGSKEKNIALSASPAFAKAKFEADIKHSNRMDEIKETGKLANARTAMIVKGKEIKMSPETRTELTDINKKRTELLSKENLTPADEKELQKLDIRQESVVNILAIDNNQLPALLRSGDSRYRTENPPPKAGAKQSELNPNEWETTKDQMRASLAASKGRSFTDMDPAAREKYLDDKMAEKYVRKGTRPAQGASAGRGVVTDGTNAALKAVRDNEIADLAGSAAAAE